MTMPTYERLEAQIIILRSLLDECQAFLFDDSGTPIAPEDLRERVNDALHADAPVDPISTFTNGHVRKFYALYTSERREVAEWLGVSRERPEENDTLYVKRTLTAAKDAGKLDELARRIDAFHSRRAR